MLQEFDSTRETYHGTILVADSAHTERKQSFVVVRPTWVGSKLSNRIIDTRAEFFHRKAYILSRSTVSEGDYDIGPIVVRRSRCLSSSMGSCRLRVRACSLF